MSVVFRKLVATIVTLLISVTMVVAVTYAWMTLSSSPAVEGFQISLAGGNTILVAPDFTTTVDGTTYHYPGYFSDKLIFSRFSEYDYLNEIDALLPVSTADGVNWFMPAYYDILDEQVVNGDACVGDLKPYSAFFCDTTLSYANLADNTEAKGHYIYLDFWVVSPGTDYTLRVSRGDENGGSFLVEIPEVVQGEDGYELEKTAGSIAASARIGFLANTVNITDNTMLYYQRSRGFDSDYTRLRGIYSESGDEYFPIDNRFLIFEPNGSLHINEDYNGTYIPTYPIGYQYGVAGETDIRDRLAVQLVSSWSEKNAQTITLDEIFQTAIAGKDVASSEEAKEIFGKYLQNQYNPYITKGLFVRKTSSLYGLAADDSRVDVEELAGLNLSDATEDTFIVELEKDVPQKIRMFIWIEGQDIDYTSVADTLSFAVSIELAGSNADEDE